jgi:preprotein translocase subunit SecA
MSFLDKILRAGEGKELRRLEDYANQINALEQDFERMADEELRGSTASFRERVENGEELDSLLPEAFAAVREASKRTLGQRHFDVQLMGGAALHRGNIAEMKTGEGKTLVATLPAYLNSLSGDGVHIVTVNDYLASYQSELMGRVFRFLNTSVGCVLTNQKSFGRKKQYDADITYGTNNEFGFDYLRDNMAWEKADLVQRVHNFAIIDEVDSILIDEARTPLIISGPAMGEANKWYVEFAKIVRNLERDVDYEIDEKKKTAGILEHGVEEVERMLGVSNLYESLNTPLIGYLNNAIRAKELFDLDDDYIVRNGEVLIVDEHTGRVLDGRRYSEGMHQAIEAKEGVKIKAENQTYATITLQNYFRMYNKLSGMTGTAETEAGEFMSTYNLGVIPIPTNKPMIRDDKIDVVYRTEIAKFNAVADDIEERKNKGQPVLVGTVSVEKSEYLSKLLRERGVEHNVLNAKQHAREAAVVALAGKKGMVTVATNMAGRGTDIMLGGNAEFLTQERLKAKGLDPEENSEEYEKAWGVTLDEVRKEVAAEHDEVSELGGLYVLGTERHESRRIDNQLRGRSGRQGDPGESRFYISLDDDLMRLFNTAFAEKMLSMIDAPDDMPIEYKTMSKSIRRAQAQIEARNFEIRKNVLKYDEVMNNQRTVMYRERGRVLQGEDLYDQIQRMIDGVLSDTVTVATLEGSPEEWNLDALWTELQNIAPITVTAGDLIEKVGIIGSLAPDDIIDAVLENAHAIYDEREEMVGTEQMRDLERKVLLSVLDRKWREHLYAMDYLKEGIGLRAMAQKDPLVEYTTEGSRMFNDMNEAIRLDTVRTLFNIQIRRVEPTDESESETAEIGITEEARQNVDLQYSAPDETAASGSPLDSFREEAAQNNAQDQQSGENAPQNQQTTPPKPAVREAEKPWSDGRTFPGTPKNADCPCGSGRKYKLCHGQNEKSAGNGNVNHKNGKSSNKKGGKKKKKR